MDLVRRIRHGACWPDGAAMEVDRNAGVVWVPADNNHAELVQLTKDFAVSPATITLNTRAANPFGGIDLDNAECLMQLSACIQGTKAVLTVIDTVGSATNRDLCRQEDARAFCTPLAQLATRTKSSILLVTHLNAGGSPLGRRIQQYTRQMLALKVIEGESSRRLAVIKSHSRTPDALRVDMGDHGNEFGPAEPPRRGRPGASSDEVDSWLAEQLNQGPMPRSDVVAAAKVAGFSTGNIYRAKERLGVLAERGESGVVWSLPPAPDATSLFPEMATCNGPYDEGR